MRCSTVVQSDIIYLAHWFFFFFCLRLPLCHAFRRHLKIYIVMQDNYVQQMRPGVSVYTYNFCTSLLRMCVTFESKKSFNAALYLLIITEVSFFSVPRIYLSTHMIDTAVYWEYSEVPVKCSRSGSRSTHRLLREPAFYTGFVIVSFRGPFVS